MTKEPLYKAIQPAIMDLLTVRSEPQRGFRILSIEDITSLTDITASASTIRRALLDLEEQKLAGIRTAHQPHRWYSTHVKLESDAYHKAEKTEKKRYWDERRKKCEDQEKQGEEILTFLKRHGIEHSTYSNLITGKYHIQIPVEDFDAFKALFRRLK